MTDELSSVVDALPALILAGSSDGRVDYLNHRWREYAGLSVEESCGAGWQSAVHPDDLPHLLGDLRSFAASRPCYEVEMEARLRRFDGEYRWFLLWASNLDDPSGRVGKWCGVAIDIDARRRFEEAILSSARDFRARQQAPSVSRPALDASLSDTNGRDVQKPIAADGVDMPIIVITRNSDIPVPMQPMKAEDIAMPFGQDVLLSTVRCATERNHTTIAEAAEMQALRDRYVSLSRREREVMTLVVSGLLNKQVGGVLGISEITVKAHRGKVMRKMKAASLADLVTMGGRLGLRASRVL